MELQKSRDWVDFILKLLAIAAIITIGAWSFYQYWLDVTNVSNIQLVVTTEVLKYSDENRLLLIHLRPKNTGKVLVSPRHITVSVRDLPIDLKPGVVDIEKLKERYKTDVLDRYEDGYDMEPNVDYDEVLTMIVPKGMYSVRGEMEFDDNSVLDHTVVARVE